MEFDCNNVDENEKYAFLLGSAIKNEDSDQFFSIYDSIIPKDLPDSQIKSIKRRVRQILDLPDEEFNDLVSKARNYSLASAGTSRMSCREPSDHSTWSQHFFEESDDEGLGSATQSQVRSAKSETSSLYSTAKCSAWSSESDTHKYEEDLNICNNSSKATNSINSLSDQDGSDCDGKTYFDYCPKIRYPPQVKIRSGLGINLDYDEAFEVKSEHSSHDDVNSPRSDVSEGVEMVTMGPGSRRFTEDVDDDLSCNRRGTFNDQDDFNTSGESDSEDHQRVRHLYSQGYRPLMRENKPLTASKYAGTKYYGDRASSSLHYPEVDHPISFSSLKDGTSKYSRHSSYENLGTTSGLTAGTKDVKFEKNSYKKDRPPFGGKEQFNKVANSIDSLITSVPDHEVKNMPEGRKLEMLTPEDNKKKKKKKKKDDVGTDQNGNPLVNPKDIKGYRQMRESPSAQEGTAGNCQNITNYGAFQYGPFSNDHSSSHKDDDASNRLHDSRSRKSKKNKAKEVEQKAEECQNYVGNKLDIEALVDYIHGGQNVSHKKSKKQSPSTTEDIPNKTQKQNKKGKDKKQKSPTPSIEEVETKVENSAQSAILVDQQVVLNNMGNLSGKSEVNASIENGDTSGSLAKKEPLPKSLLKDDKNIIVSETVIANHHMPHASNKAVYCKESVKDKEVPKTNNKRVAASDSITAGEPKQKKGGDKAAKGSKSEKVEMSVSKSESTMKIDTSVAVNNSVKQKNSKNKKSKPTSPTTKTENEVNTPEILNNQSLYSSILDNSLIDNSGFIFTDLEVPEVPKEDEFQVVGKKKKKQPAKEVAQPYQQNNYNYVNNGNKYGKRYDDKRNAYVNNKFPPPVTNNYSLQTDNDVRARDLSPSAFPALGNGKGRQSFNDGRRNSTGDVQIPSDLKSQDDCDRESVKSLPATKACNTMETVTSPRINMSYAKMAAGVSSAAVQETSSIGAGNDSSDPKITVWKGSARERRHSIGSSPEGVGITATHTQSSSTAVSMKAGSEENLKDIVSEKVVSGDITKTEDNAIANLTGVNQSQRNVAPESSMDGNLQEKEKKTTLKEAKGSASSLSVHSQPLALSKTEKSGNTSVVAPAELSNQSKEITGSGKVSNKLGVKVKGTESDSQVNSIVHGIDKQSASANSGHKNENSQKYKSNSTNNRKHKSVIFYDKRLEENPTSLDISFGFEIDSVGETVNSFDDNKNQEMSTIGNPSNNLEAGKTEIMFESSDLPALDLVQTSSSCASITFDSNSTLGQSSNVNVIVSPSDSYTNQSSGKDDIVKELNADIINDKIEKVSSRLVHLNGIVSPSQGKPSTQINEVLEDNKTPVLTEAGSQTTVQTASKVDPQITQDKRIEGIYYGENVATLKKDVVGPSSTNGPTSYCGVIHFLLEMEAKNNFFLAEAATYLTKEWERTLNLQDKDPDCVKVHHE